MFVLRPGATCWCREAGPAIEQNTSPKCPSGNEGWSPALWTRFGRGSLIGVGGHLPLSAERPPTLRKAPARGSQGGPTRYHDSGLPDGGIRDRRGRNCRRFTRYGFSGSTGPSVWQRPEPSRNTDQGDGAPEPRHSCTGKPRARQPWMPSRRGRTRVTPRRRKLSAARALLASLGQLQ